MQEQSIHQPTTQKFSHAYPPEVNVGQTERWMSFLGGSVLTVYALRQSLWGLALIAGGLALVRRGLSGHCAVYESMGVNTNHPVLAYEKATSGQGS
jgi:hypothetical protein